MGRQEGEGVDLINQREEGVRVSRTMRERRGDLRAREGAKVR